MTEKSVNALMSQNPHHAFLHDATSSYRDGPIAPAELEGIVARVSGCESLVTNQRACLVFGRGSQTREAYRQLAQSPGLHILWHGVFTPWWLRPLAVLAAAHGGLIRATDAAQAGQAVLRLSNLAMVELYSVRADLVEPVAHLVSQAGWQAHVGPVAGADPAYFSLGVDGGSSDSTTGVFVWSSFGSSCPADLMASVA